MSSIYLLHIADPLHHAAHYMGWTEADDPAVRVAEHLAGKGSPLVRAAVAAGRVVTLVRTWPGGDRELERRFKKRKNLRGLCPRCVAAYNLAAKERMRARRSAAEKEPLPA